MNIIKCGCGNEIKDDELEKQLSYKGEIIRNKNYLDFYHKIANDIAYFYLACHKGERKEFIKNYFNETEDRYTDQAVISLIMQKNAKVTLLKIFQCNNCGRLYIENMPQTNEFKVFFPDKNWHDVLEVK